MSALKTPCLLGGLKDLEVLGNMGNKVGVQILKYVCASLVLGRDSYCTDQRKEPWFQWG